MNISYAFFGAPPLALPVLEELEAAGLLPRVVVTAQDRYDTRKKQYIPAPVKAWAVERDIDVLQPETLKDGEARDLLLNSEWDLFVVASFGMILPKGVINTPRHHTLNMHPSLLPKLRGASPVRSAILRDEPASVGVTIMQLDEKLDHGPVVAQGSVELEDWPPAGDLLEELLAREGGRLLAEVIPEWLAGAITPEPQNENDATYCGKLSREDGKLELDPARDISPEGVVVREKAWPTWLKIQALRGWPGTYFFAEKNGKPLRIKITDATYADGVLTIERVIPEGSREIPFLEFNRDAS